jgi:DNA-binding CsgD family transcriptional regulator
VCGQCFIRGFSHPVYEAPDYVSGPEGQISGNRWAGLCLSHQMVAREIHKTSQRLEESDCEKLLNLASVLYSPGQSEVLRRALLTSMQSLVPHDLGAFHCMQPARHEIAAWYEPQCRPLPVAHQEFWRLIETHPLNSILFARPSRAWKVSDVMPRKEFLRTELYSALYRPLGLDCEITAVLPDKKAPGTYFLLSLHRHSVDFTERERALLNLLLPHVARTQHRLAFRRPEAPQTDGALANEEQFHQWLREQTPWLLSRRESDVLFWLCQGKTNDEIGTILGIAGRTAETHALRIYPKIGVENRYGAIATINQLAPRGGLAAPISPDAHRAGSHTNSAVAA